jgi:hypothetical protein
LTCLFTFHGCFGKIEHTCCSNFIEIYPEWNTLLHETFQLKKHVSNNSPVNRPVDPKQIATEIINTPALSPSNKINTQTCHASVIIYNSLER